MTPRALVIGAATPSGRALALALARQGYALAIAPAGPLATELRALGAPVATLPAGGDDAVPAAAQELGGPLTLLALALPELLAETQPLEQALLQAVVLPQALINAFAAQAPAPGPPQRAGPEASAQVIACLDRRLLSPVAETQNACTATSALWAMLQGAALALAPRLRVNALGLGAPLRGGPTRPPGLSEPPVDTAAISTALAYLLGAPMQTGQLLTLGNPPGHPLGRTD